MPCYNLKNWRGLLPDLALFTVEQTFKKIKKKCLFYFLATYFPPTFTSLLYGQYSWPVIFQPLFLPSTFVLATVSISLKRITFCTGIKSIHLRWGETAGLCILLQNFCWGLDCLKVSLCQFMLSFLKGKQEKLRFYICALYLILDICLFSLKYLEMLYVLYT